MSHSTTGTSSYVLSKYSRSYPTRRTLQKTQNLPNNGPELMSDWQHFTNPVICLALDVKTASSGEIESVKLRIVWRMDSGIDSGASQQNAIFEDLDLLSFSAITRAPRKNQTEGLPLKAVYRDTVVGIRYLHSREDGVTPVYRRFQISFQTQSDALNFIELIKPICPCKVNPATVHTSALSQSQTPAAQNKSEVRPQKNNLAAANPLLLNRQSQFAWPTPPIPLSNQTRTAKAPPEAPSMPSLSLSSPSLYQTFSDAPTHSLGDDHVTVPLNMPQSYVPSARTSREILPRNATIADPRTDTVSVVMPSSSLPSLPSSANSVKILSLDRTSVPTNSCAPGPGINEEPHQFLCSFVEASSIYNLPSSTLERVIGEIIHEDAFVQLLERVSEMLTIKTVLNAS